MSIFVIVILVYLGVLVIFYFFQHYFFFRPEILPSAFQYNYPFPFEELHFDMEDGGKINGIYFKVPNSLGVIFYLKGNSKSIKGWGKFAKDFVGKGYDFVMIDYRGFGKSRGRRSEAKLYNDSQYVYQWLKERYPEDKIILYGRSYGSGIAARIASWNLPAMLILDSPYTSFLALVKRWGWWMPVRWLLRYHLRTDQFMKSIRCPVYIIHGTLDKLIPYKMSVDLEKNNANKVKLISIPKARHNDLPAFAEYHEALYEIITGQDMNSKA